MREFGNWIDASRNVSRKDYDLAERTTIGGAVGIAISGVILAAGLIMERLSSESLLFKDTVFYYNDKNPDKNECVGFVPTDINEDLKKEI